MILRLVFCSALMLAGCGGGGNALPQPSGGILPAVTATSAPVIVASAPSPAPTPIVYTALGDSITATSGGYVSLIGNALHVIPTNLGIGGETVGPFSGTLPGTPPLAVSYSGLLAAEVPNIPANTNLVTLYIGTNDLWLTSQFGVPDLDFGAALASVMTAVRARVPSATIAVATVPNMTYHGGMADPVALKTIENDFDNAIRAAVMSSGAIVVDLQCLPAMYDVSNFPDPWNVHPNGTGHAAIAQAFLTALAARTLSVPATCPWTQPF